VRLPRRSPTGVSRSKVAPEPEGPPVPQRDRVAVRDMIARYTVGRVAVEGAPTTNVQSTANYAGRRFQLTIPP
jgi:hypothetical protein